MNMYRQVKFLNKVIFLVCHKSITHHIDGQSCGKGEFIVILVDEIDCPIFDVWSDKIMAICQKQYRAKLTNYITKCHTTD